MKNLYKYYLLIILLLSFASCALDVPEEGFEYLAPPVILNQWQDGNNIILQFKGYNKEYYFDGYNVYISTTSMIRTAIKSYKPVQISGCASCELSFPLSPDDYNPDLIRTITLYQYYLYTPDTGEYVPQPFSAGTTYYILMGSHHRLLGVNEDGVSNPVSINF